MRSSNSGVDSCKHMATICLSPQLPLYYCSQQGLPFYISAIVGTLEHIPLMVWRHDGKMILKIFLETIYSCPPRNDPKACVHQNVLKPSPHRKLLIGNKVTLHCKPMPWPRDTCHPMFQRSYIHSQLLHNWRLVRRRQRLPHYVMMFSSLSNRKDAHFLIFRIRREYKLHSILGTFIFFLQNPPPFPLLQDFLDLLHVKPGAGQGDER